jgi:hypothetical protein
LVERDYDSTARGVEAGTARTETSKTLLGGIKDCRGLDGEGLLVRMEWRNES